MKISLITPTPPDISAFGLRALSAYLKQAGHDVRNIFLPGGIELLRHGGDFKYEYSPDILQQILTIIEESDLIGISFMSQYRDRAIQLTEFIKSKMNVFVVWGGIHAEACPDESVRYADGVCLTEGESVIPQLLKNLQTNTSVHKIPGLLTSQKNQLPFPPLITDLDTLPPVDFDIDNHWVLNPISSKIKPLTAEWLAHILPTMPAPKSGALTVYRIMTSRGCPHRCSYCASGQRADQFKKQKYLRFRSPDHVLDELHSVLKIFPFIKGIHFFDDVFTAMKPANLETLCQRFKSEINLPYYLQVSPSTLSKRQISMFIETGAVFVELGIQTGSSKIRNIYKRTETNEQILDVCKMIHQHRDKLLKPHYHVILDNPWETRDDLRETLDLLTRVPGRFKLCLASLTPYPGTQIYTKMKNENLIRNEETEIYRKPFYIPKGRYLNYLIYLTDINWIPGVVLRWLGGSPASLFDKPIFSGLFNLARKITDKFRLLGKGLQAVFRCEFSRIFRYVHRTK